MKEIGNDNALIFYEGLRPIRCKKIRYYADRRFRRATCCRRRGTQRPFLARAHPYRHAPPVTAAAAPAPAGGEALTPETRMPTPRRFDARCGRRGHRAIGFAHDRGFWRAPENFKFEHAGERPTESELDADVNHFLDAIR